MAKNLATLMKPVAGLHKAVALKRNTCNHHMYIVLPGGNSGDP
jgi:hypothetical protein